MHIYSWIKPLVFFAGLFFLITSVDHVIAQAAVVSGELRRRHPITLTFDGPATDEQADPNPFLDYRLDVTFTNGGTTYTVPGFYAADGNAAETSATSGNKWQVRFTPDTVGTWTYTASFVTGDDIAVNLAEAGTPTSFDGATGTFSVSETNKSGDDFRAKGMLRYVGEHYLQFAGTGEYYLKNGADSPENFLAYYEFDGTYDTGGIIDNFLHEYAPHAGDWQAGDPTWQGNKGQNIIGALNYLASQNVNSVYFLTYNLDGGDGADTWMWTDDTTRDRFDVSKLDQWEIVFRHMTNNGIQLHVVTQEEENDERLGPDSGLNAIRRLYYRELVARFSHHAALIWNIGEENQNTDADQMTFAQYIRDLDPYDHPITVHTRINQASTFYDGLLGNTFFEASSIQGLADRYNEWAVELRQDSTNAGRPWAIFGDERVPAVSADMGNINRVTRDALWGNLMGGGAGVEWYFGYQDDFGDVQSEDWRVAEPLWQQSNHAIEYFHQYLPFWEMEPVENLLSTEISTLVMSDEVYTTLLTSAELANGVTFDQGPVGTVFDISWYNPLTGSALSAGTVSQITADGSAQSIGMPPSDPNQEWVVLITAEDFELPDVTPPPDDYNDDNDSDNGNDDNGDGSGGDDSGDDGGSSGDDGNGNSDSNSSSSNGDNLTSTDDSNDVPVTNAAGRGLSLTAFGFLNNQGNVEWFITVTNNTESAVPSPVLTKIVSDEVSILNTLADVGEITVNGQIITVNIPTLQVGQQVIVTVTTEAGGGSLPIRACLSADEISDICSDGILVTSLPQTGETPWWRR